MTGYAPLWGAVLCALSTAASAVPVFINEIHYDNSGADVDEAVEIAGPAGTDLSNWSVVLYNGGTGKAYKTIELKGLIPDDGDGFGFLAFFQSGFQNGAPDGLALVDDVNSPLQFLSYEGAFTAMGGAADGLTSTDIGIIEPGSSPIGSSIYLTGSGSRYADFTWATGLSSFGSVNSGQTFRIAGRDQLIDGTAPLPSPIWLLGVGALPMILRRGLKRAPTPA